LYLLPFPTAMPERQLKKNSADFPIWPIEKRL
jgi:hypothetical protein